MLLERHELTVEFPEFRTTIERLAASDTLFAKLLNEYDALDDQILRMEQGVEPHADDFAEALKIRRVHLKDALVHKLRQVDFATT